MSDYLTDEEQAQRLERWWERYGLLAIGAVVVAVLAVIGYRWFEDQRAEERALGASLYEDFLSATDSRKADLARQLDDAAGGTGYPLLARFRLAGDAVKEEDYATARQRYQEIMEQTDEPAIRDLALVRLARVEAQLDNTDAALATLQRARSEGFRSQVLELKGDILLSKGDDQAAREAYRAALDALADGQTNPLLELKVSTIAQAKGTAAQEAAIVED